VPSHKCNKSLVSSPPLPQLFSYSPFSILAFSTSEQAAARAWTHVFMCHGLFILMRSRSINCARERNRKKKKDEERESFSMHATKRCTRTTIVAARCSYTRNAAVTNESCPLNLAQSAVPIRR